MTEPTALMTYFPTREDAQDATMILDVFFTVRPPHIADEPLDGRPWAITVLVHEGVSEETLHVTPDMWNNIISVVDGHGGRIADTDQGWGGLAQRLATDPG